MTTQVEERTIARIRETPQRQVKLRGKLVEAVQPCVGSVVTCSDNGFSPRIGSTESFVVTQLHQVKKTGTVTGVTLAPIVRLDDNSVTYNAAKQFNGPKLYNNGGGPSWDDEPTHNLCYYRWDHYAPTDDGVYSGEV